MVPNLLKGENTVRSTATKVSLHVSYMFCSQHVDELVKYWSSE